MSERNLYDIIAAEISRFVSVELPCWISTIRDELILVMDDRLRVLQAELEASRPYDFGVTFKEFYSCGALCFMGRRDSSVSMRWIADVESAFRAKFCPDEVNVRFLECLLCDGAMDWWREVNVMRSSLCHGRILSLDS